VAEDRNPWWTHIFPATVIAGGFAAVPFWTRGLSLEIATVAAGIIFPLMIVAYIYVVTGK
jgi:hypothetical protein